MGERHSNSSESAKNYRAAKRAVYTVTVVGALSVVGAKTLPSQFEDHGADTAATQSHLILSTEEANSYFTKPNSLYTIPTEAPTQAATQSQEQGPLPTLSPADVGSYFTSNSTGEQAVAAAPSVATEAATQPPTQPATEVPTVIPTDTPTPTQAATEIPTSQPTEPPTQEVVENTPVSTQEPTEIPSPTETEVSTVAPTEVPSPTMIPTREPTLAPTNTPTPVPTDTPMPTATPTEVPTQTPTPKPEKTVAPTPDVLPTLSPDMSIPEQLKVINPDYGKMDELAQENTKLYGDAAPQYLCLQGVRLTIDQVYPDMDSALRIPSAYLAKGVFEEYPNRFAELKITSRKQLYELPPGAILVYQPNPDGGDPYDYAGGIHNGHIEIVISNDMNGTVIVGSDHQNSLDDDLIHMQGHVSVFVPINHHAPNTETTPEVTVQAAESNPPIADPLPVVKGLGEEAPHYYETADEYKKALKDTFNIDMEGYDKDHLEWVWELLWKTDKTNFPKLLEGNTYNFKPYSSDGSTSDNVSIQEGSQVDSVTGKETASVITLVGWPTKATFLAFFIHESAHGVQANQPDSVSYFSETEQQFYKQGAIDWYGGNAQTVFKDVSDVNENYAEAFRLYLMSYLLPNYNLSLLAVGDQNEANPFVASRNGQYGQIMHKVLFQKLPKN